MKTTRRACRRWLPALAVVGVLLPAEAQGQTPSELFEQTTYAVGSGPQGLVAADLDGDDDLDLVVANRFSASLSVLLGQGDGSFAPASSLAVGSQPLAVAAADFDGDGLLDLASANAGSSSVSYRYGLGGGAFSAVTQVSVGAQPRDLAAGDLDGDGVADLALAHDSMSTPVSLLLSADESPGAIVVDAGFRAAALVLADLDGDGLLDLVLNDSSFHRVRTYRGLGGGSLAPAVHWPVLLDPRDVAVLDADGDGVLDIVALCQSASMACLLAGAGDGSFVAAGDFATGLMPQQVAAGDIDADGDPDLLTTNFGGGDVSLLLGDGAGGFEAPQSMLAGVSPAGIVVADTSGGGVPDVVVSNAFSNNVTVFTATTVAGPPPWVDLGGAVAGRMGALSLVVEGLPVAGQSVTFTVVSSKRNTPPAFLFYGFAEQSIPFKGGVFVPTIDGRLRVRTNQPVSFVWPDVPPGTPVTFQAWLQPQAAAGIASGSNALRGTTQAP